MSNDAFLSSREAEHEDRRFRSSRRNAAADLVVNEKSAPNHSKLLALMGAVFLIVAISAPFIFGAGKSDKQAAPAAAAPQGTPAPPQDEGEDVRDALQVPGRPAGAPEPP